MSTVAAPRRTAVKPAGPLDPLWAFLRPIASLRLTVVLLSLSLGLVFFGTLAQIDNGIHNVVPKYFHWYIVWVPFQLFVEFGQKFLWIPKTWSVPGAFPYPGGYTLGFALLINLLAAHAVRLKISWKRIGVWLIHAGLILLLVGEFLTGIGAKEGRMTIDEGSAANYVEDFHRSELAFVTPSGKDEDVVVVPQSMLASAAKRKQRVADPKIPVEIEVLKFMPNSARVPAPLTDNPADKGLGLLIGAEERPGVSGVDTNQSVDVPSAYVRFYFNGEPVGTYLLTGWNAEAQKLELPDGRSFEVALRFERRYLPFKLQLTKFRFDRYTGTETAKNYSSDVRVIDPERGEDREVRISMNAPLRYRGETFYQSSFDEKTEQTTILQVVRNRAWTMPYLACSLVSGGMLLHFGMYLVQFLRRRQG